MDNKIKKELDPYLGVVFLRRTPRLGTIQKLTVGRSQFKGFRIDWKKELFNARFTRLHCQVSLLGPFQTQLGIFQLNLIILQDVIDFPNVSKPLLASMDPNLIMGPAVPTPQLTPRSIVIEIETGFPTTVGTFHAPKGLLPFFLPEIVLLPVEANPEASVGGDAAVCGGGCDSGAGGGHQCRNRVGWTRDWRQGRWQKGRWRGDRWW